MEPLTLLESCAGEFSVELIEADTRTSTVALTLQRASHASVKYHLRLVSNGSEVSAGEVRPTRLPAHCPERHINADGTFCTHWVQGDPRPVADLDSARQWWSLLRSFLERQETATQLGKWFGPTRAHGQAAHHQNRAEQIAREFGEAFLGAVVRNEFEVRRTERRGRSRLELLRRGDLVNRLALPSRALSNPQAPCPCESSGGNTPIAQCRTHREDMAQLIDQIYRWSKLEAEFNQHLRRTGFRCCGTLRTCPFK